MSQSTNGGTTIENLLRSPRLWVAVVVAVAAVAFIAQNREPMTINLFTIRVAASQWLTMTVLFLAGCATGFLLHGRK